VGEAIVARFDHAFVVRRTAANTALIDAIAAHYNGVVVVDWQPTSENLVAHFVELLTPRLPAGVTLRALKLSETATSFAEWVDGHGGF
jgi:6-pyruvoyltetrahydropterin/6-carboxytetrahydropterin synthase